MTIEQYERYKQDHPECDLSFLEWNEMASNDGDMMNQLMDEGYWDDEEYYGDDDWDGEEF